MSYGTLASDVIQSSTTGTPPQFNDGSGTQIGTLCRAWVNYNGANGTIRASFNISSVTRNGTGDYTINFSNSMADTNYSYSGAMAPNSTSTVVILAESSATTRTASLFRIYTSAQGGTVFDPPICMVLVFR
jgi:hypothetical protein